MKPAENTLQDKLQTQFTYELLLQINTQEELTNITPNILLVIPKRNPEQIFLQSYHNSLLASQQGTWNTFGKTTTYIIWLAKYECFSKHVTYVKEQESSH